MTETAPSLQPCCLIAFDIDGCLMDIDQPADEDVRLVLSELQEAGAHIVLASGKPCVYLSGLARGLGIMAASLIGENGAEIWISSTMPPRQIAQDVGAEERMALAALADEARMRYGSDVFLQPNAYGVTVFPAAPGLTPEIVARDMERPLPAAITRYLHEDSVDWAISRFDKGVAVRALAEHLGIPLERTAAVGNGSNDLPMLSVVARAFWVGPPHKVAGTGIVAMPDVHCVLRALADAVRVWQQQ